MNPPILIGIAGGTGSGKTTLTKQIVRHFGEDVTVIRHDNYYRAHPDLDYGQRAALNYDCPVYDYTVHNRSEKTEHIEPTQVIIVEGILIFADEALCSHMDIKLFVDTDADVRILRRIRRDVRDRGRSLDSVINQYLETVKPMHEQYVQPSRKNADLIIPEGGKNLVALEMIFTRIEDHIRA